MTIFVRITQPILALLPELPCPGNPHWLQTRCLRVERLGSLDPFYDQTHNVTGRCCLRGAICFVCFGGEGREEEASIFVHGHISIANVTVILKNFIA